MKYKKVALFVLALVATMFCGATAGAQITGKLVSPNIMLVIDSSGSMDWLPDNPDSANQSWAEAEAECGRANTIGMTEKRTSWQQLKDVMLGDISTEDFHCFVETVGIRPGLHRDTVQSDITYNISDYTSSSRNHYRSVSCSDGRVDGSRGNWNITYNQCIGEDLTPTIKCSDGSTANVSTHVTQEGYICWDWVDYDGDCTKDSDEVNYVSATGDAPELCYNYHPLAEARQANGILERYRTLARFGIMTYDNKPKPLSTAADQHAGLFDYGTSRTWNCHQWTDNTAVPGDTKCTWNAGARSDDQNAVGGLVKISDDLNTSNAAVREVLETAEPLYCSPLAALIDDVGYYFRNEPDVGPTSPITHFNSGKDLYFNCRPKLVIVISDGEPTPAFEFPQEVCDTNAPVAPWEIESTETYSCPWNSSVVEAGQIADLIDPSEAYPVYTVYIGLNVADKEGLNNRCSVAPTWNAFAQPGGLCVSPADDCVQIRKLDNQTDCEAGADAFLTPRDFLNRLALAGWPSDWEIQPPWRDSSFHLFDSNPNFCGGEQLDPPYNERGAIFVNSANELSSVLDLVISMFTAAVGTRTEIATTNQVASGALGASQWSGSAKDDEAVAQYEFNSGYEVQSGTPWKGFLYRQGYSCKIEGESDSDTLNGELDHFHTMLKSQASSDERRIYTITDDGLSALAYGDEGIKKGFDSVLLEITDSSGVDDCDIGGPQQDNVCNGNTDILTLLETHLYGKTGSKRADHPLADIYNSTPAILAPPMERLPIASYQEFKTSNYTDENGDTKKKIERPPTLYVGTNDGVLHSFHVWADDSSNVENWGFVPNKLLDSIYKQYPIAWKVSYDETSGNADSYTVLPVDEQPGFYQHIFGLDGSPVTADVRLWRERIPGASSVKESDLWRSLVVGGLGKGGAGYYCLDVTDDPQAPPRFRWEISSKSVANNTAGAFNKTDGSFGIGLTLAKPALAYVHVKDELPVGGASGTETEYELAVAILPGGYVNDENGGIEKSTGVYIVRAADGHKIKYLDPVLDNCDYDTLSNAEKDELVAQMVGEPAIPGGGTRAANVTDEAFLGDDRGRLWRIDMSDKDPDEWCLEMFFDTLLKNHYEYKDCQTGGNACCDSKMVDPANSCSSGEIDQFANDNDLGIEACTGQPCVSVGYPFPRTPIVNAPTIVQDENRNNVIIFGTGQIDNLEALDHNRIFSLTEIVSYTVGAAGSDSTTSNSEPEINWWLGEAIPADAKDPENYFDGKLDTWNTDMPGKRLTDGIVPGTQVMGSHPLNMGEKLLGKPTVFNKVAYFTTFMPLDVSDMSSLDACNSGGSKLWGVNYTDASTTALFKQLKWEEGGSTKTEAYKEYPGELLTGSKIVRRPSCSGDAAFQLVAQKANPNASSSGATSSTPKVVTAKITLQPGSNKTFTTVAIDSWSLVFN